MGGKKQCRTPKRTEMFTWTLQRRCKNSSQTGMLFTPMPKKGKKTAIILPKEKKRGLEIRGYSYCTKTNANLSSDTTNSPRSDGEHTMKSKGRQVRTGKSDKEITEQRDREDAKPPSRN